MESGSVDNRYYSLIYFPATRKTVPSERGTFFFFLRRGCTKEQKGDYIDPSYELLIPTLPRPIHIRLVIHVIRRRELQVIMYHY